MHHTASSSRKMHIHGVLRVAKLPGFLSIMEKLHCVHSHLHYISDEGPHLA
jgi:hypothetical protein